MGEVNQYQQKYWEELYLTQYAIYYYNFYKEKYEKYDRNVKIFLSVSSSASIGAWTIWKNCGYLWGIIIAASQVINAIKHLFPWESKLKGLSGLLREYSKIYLKADSDLFLISEGYLTIEEINKRTSEIKQLKLDVQLKYLENITLPHNDKLRIKAEELTETFFQ